MFLGITVFKCFCPKKSFKITLKRGFINIFGFFSQNFLNERELKRIRDFIAIYIVLIFQLV